MQLEVKNLGRMKLYCNLQLNFSYKFTKLLIVNRKCETMDQKTKRINLRKWHELKD